MLYCSFIVFDRLFVIFLILINISQVVICVAVTRIDLNGLFIPLYSLFNIVLSLVNDGSIIVRSVVLWVCLNSLSIIANSLHILFHIIICYSC